MTADTLTVRVWHLDFSNFRSPAAKLVTLAIARRARGNGICWARQSTLGADCGVSKQTISRCLAELEEAGYLKREPRYDKHDGGRVSDLMWLTLPELKMAPTGPSEEDLAPEDVRALKGTTVEKRDATMIGGAESHRSTAPTKESPLKDSLKESILKERERHHDDDAGGDEDSPPGEDIPAAVEMIWKAGSSIARTRSSKADIESGLRAALKRGAALESIMRGYGAYLRTPDATKDDGAFQRGAHVILAKDRWAGYLEEAPNTPAVGAPPATTTPATADERTIWGLRVELFSKGKAWDSNHGPEPGRLGCLAPPDILAAYGFTQPDVGDDNAGAFD